MIPSVSLVILKIKTIKNKSLLHKMEILQEHGRARAITSDKINHYVLCVIVNTFTTLLLYNNKLKMN